MRHSIESLEEVVSRLPFLEADRHKTIKSNSNYFIPVIAQLKCAVITVMQGPLSTKVRIALSDLINRKNRVTLRIVVINIFDCFTTELLISCKILIMF